MNRHYPAFLLLALTLAAQGEALSALAQDRYIYWIGAIQAEETPGQYYFSLRPRHRCARYPGASQGSGAGGEAVFLLCDR